MRLGCPGSEIQYRTYSLHPLTHGFQGGIHKLLNMRHKICVEYVRKIL